MLINKLLTSLLLTASCQGRMLTKTRPLEQTVLADALEGKQIFHGTSLIIQPDYESRQARNGSATAASFYCYYGVHGYLSFGW
jgi:hypothetical protein